VRQSSGDWWARAFPPPLRPTDLSNASFVLCSHEHTDHFDGQTLAPIASASPAARFVVSGWCQEHMPAMGIAPDRVIVPTALQPLTLPGTNIRLTAIPAAHYELAYDEHKGYRWLGFLIEWNGVTLYHAGDTLIYPDYVPTLRRLPAADLAMLPVNGRDWFRETEHDVFGNLWPGEAARLAHDLRWDVVIPGHNDLFPNNTIPNADIVEAFDRLVPRQKLRFLQPGELYYYVK
jgi:L-ascorbate metabolism protein UlaG (beta-lactamase superfamily)